MKMMFEAYLGIVLMGLQGAKGNLKFIVGGSIGHVLGLAKCQT